MRRTRKASALLQEFSRGSVCEPASHLEVKEKSPTFYSPAFWYGRHKDPFTMILHLDRRRKFVMKDVNWVEFVGSEEIVRFCARQRDGMKL